MTDGVDDSGVGVVAVVGGLGRGGVVVVAVSYTHLTLPTKVNV